MRVDGVAALAALVAVPQTAQPPASASYCASYALAPSYETTAFYAPMAYRTQPVGRGKVLIAEGEIAAGEADRLRIAIDKAGGIDEIWFNSPGGAALEGPKMGRIIRQKGLAVRLRANHACISACSYAFLGGAVRIVEPGAQYGIHMFSVSGDSAAMLSMVEQAARISAERQRLIRSGKSRAAADAEAAAQMGDQVRRWEQTSAQTAAVRARYLVEMSLSLDFMTDAFGTQATKVCFLSAAGLARYNVANAR